MSEIIWGIDTRTSTTNTQPIKRLCKEQGIMCELATEFGYCKITGCVHRTIHYGAKMEENEVKHDD